MSAVFAENSVGNDICRGLPLVCNNCGLKWLAFRYGEDIELAVVGLGYLEVHQLILAILESTKGPSGLLLMERLPVGMPLRVNKVRCTLRGCLRWRVMHIVAAGGRWFECLFMWMIVMRTGALFLIRNGFGQRCRR